MPAEFEPTTDQRALVQNAAAFGINQADIANQLNIDEKTLRKHFREELNSGKFKVDMLAGRTVTELMKLHEPGFAPCPRCCAGPISCRLSAVPMSAR